MANGFKMPYILSEKLEFPPVEICDSEGLLAMGGDLSPERLLHAYHNGIFPWFNDDGLILWWCPDPRMVLYPENLKVSKSMRKVLRNQTFTLTKNTCFERVITECATIERPGQDGTWLTPEMLKAYCKLYELGHAHSYEVWFENSLVGGLYGIDLGHVFCGESMFSKMSNASKFAFINMANQLKDKKYALIDCQVYTGHLASLGASEISRTDFLKILKKD
jgi:leucyl/phenylalanyl-tRNA--protein transferase